MRPGSKLSLMVIFVITAALAGCAGIQRASIKSGRHRVLPIQTGSYYFYPNEIRIDKPGPVAFEIENVSSSRANFTLKDPKWRTLANVDIPPHVTTMINVEFHMSGVYQFYSDSPLAKFMGMNGQISVGKQGAGRQ